MTRLGKKHNWITAYILRKEKDNDSYQKMVKGSTCFVLKSNMFTILLVKPDDDCETHCLVTDIGIAFQIPNRSILLLLIGQMNLHSTLSTAREREQAQGWCD